MSISFSFFWLHFHTTSPNVFLQSFAHPLPVALSFLPPHSSSTCLILAQCVLEEVASREAELGRLREKAHHLWEGQAAGKGFVHRVSQLSAQYLALSNLTKVILFPSHSPAAILVPLISNCVSACEMLQHPKICLTWLRSHFHINTSEPSVLPRCSLLHCCACHAIFPSSTSVMSAVISLLESNTPPLKGTESSFKRSLILESIYHIKVQECKLTFDSVMHFWNVIYVWVLKKLTFPKVSDRSHFWLIWCTVKKKATEHEALLRYLRKIKVPQQWWMMIICFAG